jgi:hypothetical protein
MERLNGCECASANATKRNRPHGERTMPNPSNRRCWPACALLPFAVGQAHARPDRHNYLHHLFDGHPPTSLQEALDSQGSRADTIIKFLVCGNESNFAVGATQKDRRDFLGKEGLLSGPHVASSGSQTVTQQARRSAAFNGKLRKGHNSAPYALRYRLICLTVVMYPSENFKLGLSWLPSLSIGSY